MKTKVEMGTCGENGLATNKGEVLLHSEPWWVDTGKSNIPKREKKRRERKDFYNKMEE